jgi:hypothetical protein
MDGIRREHHLTTPENMVIQDGYSWPKTIALIGFSVTTCVRDARTVARPHVNQHKPRGKSLRSRPIGFLSSLAAGMRATDSSPDGIWHDRRLQERRDLGQASSAPLRDD